MTTNAGEVPDGKHPILTMDTGAYRPPLRIGDTDGFFPVLSRCRAEAERAILEGKWTRDQWMDVYEAMTQNGYDGFTAAVSKYFDPS